MMRLVGVVAAALLGGVSLLIVGAFLGGNFLTRFELFGLRGYEATGLLGFLVGVAAGVGLALRRRHSSSA